MLFNSFVFIGLFFPLVWVGYFAFRHLKAQRLAIIFLLAASYVFYIYGEHLYWWLIALSVLFNFFIGAAIRRYARGRKYWLAAGVGGNLLALIVFKYSNFIFSQLVTAGLVGPPDWHITLPIGISFYTFTQIAYLVDVYRGEAKDYDPVSYGLFVTFFPHLIAGPILHHKEMMPQFRAGKAGRLVEHLASGLPIFIIGLFKKAVLADMAAPAVDLFFQQSHGGLTPHLIAAWGAAIAYTVQIYFDFSGYSDMAIGLARMLGIDLPINFNSPYKAVNIADFWRRWHITLSRFLRDYLYVPLGGNRNGKVRRYVNLLATMVIGGIWHGAGWNFALWGALHGVALVLNRLWTDAIGKTKRPMPVCLARALTLLAVIVAWVPFRAPDLSSTIAIWRGMVGLGGLVVPSNWPHGVALAHYMHLRSADIGVNGTTTLGICLMFLAALMLPNSQQLVAPAAVGLDSPGYDAKPVQPTPLVARWWGTVPAAMTLGIAFGTALRTIGGYSAFIYFQF